VSGLKRMSAFGAQGTAVFSPSASRKRRSMAAERMAWAPALPPMPTMREGSNLSSAACSRAQRMAERASCMASRGEAPGWREATR